MCAKSVKSKSKTCQACDKGSSEGEFSTIYTLEIAGTTASVSGYGSKISTRTTYKNPEKHEIFICSKCKITRDRVSYAWYLLSFIIPLIIFSVFQYYRYYHDFVGYLDLWGNVFYPTIISGFVLLFFSPYIIQPAQRLHFIPLGPEAIAEKDRAGNNKTIDIRAMTQGEYNKLNRRNY